MTSPREGRPLYILRYSPDSASLIVRLVLTELGVPYVARLIDREAGELASAGYRALHPLGKIPAIETPNGPMFESAAILLYLSDRHPGLAPGPGDHDRAAFLKWLFFTSTNIHTAVMDVFYPDRVAGDAAAGAVLAHASARLRTFLSALNQAAEDKPSWLCADKPSVLGYYIAVLMRWLGECDKDTLAYVKASDYPALHAVLAMLEQRPAALAVAEAEGLGITIFTCPG